MVADLLERGQELEHEAAPADSLRLGDLGHRLPNDRLVERHLLGGQGNQPIRLRLRRQVGSDRRVGLAPTQQERSYHPGEGVDGGRVAVAFDGDGDPPTERLERAEQAGRGPVEDRPEIGEAVLDRRAGEGDPAGHGQRPQRASRARQGVLGVLGLVGDDQPPRLLGQDAVIAAHHAVGGEHEPVGGDVAHGAVPAVETPDRQSGRESLDLALPVGQQRGRADHQSRPALANGLLLLAPQVQRDHLHGLAEAHVVGQAAAEAQLGQCRHPRHPSPLVGPQRRRQPRRLRGIGLLLERGEAVGQRRDRPHDRGRDHLAIDLDRAAESRAEGVAAVHPRPTPQLRHQVGVHHHPPTAHAHERSLRLGQHGELLGRQVVAVHRDGPAELEQGLQREAGGRDGRGLGRSDHGAQLWMPRQLGGHEDVDADGAQAGPGVAEEVHHVGVAQGQRAGPGLLQQAGQRWPGAAAAAQRQEQIGVGTVAEAGGDGGGSGPDVGGVDGEARVHGAGELHHCDERAVGPVR